MADEPSQPEAFPAPVRIGGYLRWTWTLFRAALPRLLLVFAGGVALVRTVHFLLVVGVGQATSGRSGDVATLATSLASGVTLSAVVGSVLAALAALVLVSHLAGRTLRPGDAWRRLRPRLSFVLISGLYVSMPLVLFLFVVGPAVEILLTVMILPALLGPPVLAQAIAWEGRDFREGATRAKNLLAGNWGRVASALLLIAVGAALLEILALTLAGLLLPNDTPEAPFEYAAALVLEVTATGIVWLFTTAAATVAYLDVRARFEAFGSDELSTEADAMAIAQTA